MGRKKQNRTISVYLKTGRNAATSYYRFVQFFDKIDADFSYHLMIPDNHLRDFYPISIQRLWKKVYIFIFIYIRVLINLICDILKKPDYVIISRCLIPRKMPYSCKIILLLLKKCGSKIFYDFDDNVIFSKEISRPNFDFLTSISDIVIVGSPYLGLLINESKEKIHFLPTTDGDMYKVFDDKYITQRLHSFDLTINIVWVGTFSGLIHLRTVMDSLEEFGKYLKKNQKKVNLYVVCDSFLDYTPKSFVMNNIKWTRKDAIDAILNAHIGIMPLQDDEFTRGKCAFKLIQYLSAGLPAIGTNVGMSKDVLSKGGGIGLNTNDCYEWKNAFIQLTKEKKVWHEYSKNALNNWMENYSFSDNLIKWKSYLSYSI